MMSCEKTKPESKRKTYRELRDVLATLPDEHLDKPIVWTGEDRGGSVYGFWRTEEDWHYNPDGMERHAQVIKDTMEEEDLTEEEAREEVGPPRYPTGSLLLEVDASFGMHVNPDDENRWLRAEAIRLKKRLRMLRRQVNQAEAHADGQRENAQRAVDYQRMAEEREAALRAVPSILTDRQRAIADMIARVLDDASDENTDEDERMALMWLAKRVSP